MGTQVTNIIKDRQYFKFCLYGFLKNLRFFEPFLIIFFLQKGLTYFEIAGLYAIREIAINLFELPSGIIADGLGRRKTLAGSFLIYIISFVLFFMGSSYWLLASAMVCYALGDAVRSGTNKAMIVGYLEQTGQSDLRVDYYGHTRSWSQYGSAVSSLIAGFIVFFNENLSTIFLFSVVPYLIDFINVLSYPKSLDKLEVKTSSVSVSLTETISVFIATMKNRYLLKILLSTTLYAGYYKSLKDFIQPFIKTSIIVIPVLVLLDEHQKLSVLLGITYFLIFIASAIASRNSERVTNWLGGRKKTLNISLLVGILLGLGSGLIMSYWTYPLLAILLFIFLLMLENLRKPTAVAEITYSGQAKVHASIFSVMSQFTSIVTAVLALIVGYIADHVNLGWGISAVAILLLVLYPLSRLNALKGG